MILDEIEKVKLVDMPIFSENELNGILESVNDIINHKLEDVSISKTIDINVAIVNLPKIAVFKTLEPHLERIFKRDTISPYDPNPMTIPDKYIEHDDIQSKIRKEVEASAYYNTTLKVVSHMESKLSLMGLYATKTYELYQFYLKFQIEF